MSEKIRTCIIGVGGMAIHHIPTMLQNHAEIVVVCEPSDTAYQLACGVFKQAGITPPPNQPDLARLLQDYAGQLDAAFIITPHVYHHDQTKMCLEAGLDVLLEKPMVMNAQEAESLIRIRDKTGKLLVVAFQGGLSPHVRKAVEMLRSGELGELLSISGTIWQNWRAFCDGTWRQQPELSGGGFMFDTGAHMLNTICDLAGEDFKEVGAWLDNRNRDVDILGAVIGRLQSGAFVTINGCGDTIPACSSEIMVFCTGAILRTGAWGGKLEIQRDGDKVFSSIDVPPMGGAWEQFVYVRKGDITNPCPPEVGLRMARLWDAIKASAARNGQPVEASN